MFFRCSESILNISPLLLNDASYWVMVDYFGTAYPGRIIEIRDNVAYISTLSQAGLHYKYPTPLDIHTYPILSHLYTLIPCDIVEKIKETTLLNSRGFYRL